MKNIYKQFLSKAYRSCISLYRLKNISINLLTSIIVKKNVTHLLISKIKSVCKLLIINIKAQIKKVHSTYTCKMVIGFVFIFKIFIFLYLHGGKPEIVKFFKEPCYVLISIFLHIPRWPFFYSLYILFDYSFHEYIC